ILPDMTRQNAQRPQQNTPAFLTRIRAKSNVSLPDWMDWHIAAIAATLIVFGLLLWVLSPILAPFLAAAMLAYIFAPMVNRLEAFGLPRSAGTIIAVLSMVVAVCLLLLIILPLFIKEIELLTQSLPIFFDQLRSTALPWINAGLGTEITLDASSIRQFMQDNLADAGGIAKRLFAVMGTGGLAIIVVLVNLALIPVVLFYGLRDWEVMVDKIDQMIPRRFHDTVTIIAKEIDQVLSEFLRGQVMVMIVMAVFYVIGLWTVGLKFALPVGLITGLLVFVPYLGVGLGLLMGTIAALMQVDPTVNIALVWGVFGPGQVIEGFFVTPKFVGERIGLHPVAVIFALMAFGQGFGFFGVLMALPASAAILVGLRHLKKRYQSSALFRR
ncbi:MAG: AI-2E family transporter, partial [Pseudomonadota bacterium]